MPRLNRIFSKRTLPRWRFFSLFTVHLLFGIHLVHWLIRGRTLAPFEFSESLYTLHEGVVTLGCFFALAAVLGTTVFGRFFCGWGCHILALQDLCSWLLARVGIHPKPIRSRFMAWVPAGVLAYAYVWPQLERIIAHLPHPILRIQQDADGWASFITRDLFRAMPGPAFTALTFAVCGCMTVYFLGSRSFCYSVCPYGAVFGWVERFSPGARLVLKGGCENCGLCTLNCKSGVKVIQELKQFGTVVDANCLKSMDCLSGCPSEAIGLAFLPRPGKRKGQSRLSAAGKKYDFTWRQEILFGSLFLILFVAYRGLYEIGLFLAASIAAIGGALGVRFLAAWSRQGFRRMPLPLRSGAPLFLVVTIYGACIHYHVYKGQELFHGNNDPAECLRHLRFAYDWGIFREAGAERDLALTYSALGEPEPAELFFRKYLGKRGQDLYARVRYGQSLSARGREAEAYKQYLAALIPDSALESRDDRIWRGLAHASIARHWANLGDTVQALRHLEQAIGDAPREASHYCNYGYLCIRKGDFILARQILARAGSECLPSKCVEDLARIAEQARPAGEGDLERGPPPPGDLPGPFQDRR